VKLYARLAQRGVPALIRLACVLALLALGLVCWSVLNPRPLPVIFAMSLGHAIGGTAFVCYLLAVVLDAGQRTPPLSAPSASEPATGPLVEPAKQPRSDS
jgi:hypothetical protein